MAQSILCLELLDQGLKRGAVCARTWTVGTEVGNKYMSTWDSLNRRLRHAKSPLIFLKLIYALLQVTTSCCWPVGN